MSDDDYQDHADRLEAIETQLLVIRGLAEKAEREIRHIGMVLGGCAVVFMMIYFSR
jgi:hypothetical protein